MCSTEVCKAIQVVVMWILPATQVPTWILNEMQLVDALPNIPRPPPSTPAGLDISHMTVPLPPEQATFTANPRPKNFAMTPDISSPKLLSATPPSLSPTLSVLQAPLGCVASGNSATEGRKQIAIEPVRLPTPRNLKSANSTNSLSSTPTFIQTVRGGPKFNPLNIKKAHSQAELGGGRGKPPPSLAKQRSLSQVKSQLARVSVSSRDSVKRGSSVDSVAESSVGSSSSSCSSPLIQQRRMSLPSQQPELRLGGEGRHPTDMAALPKLATRTHHKIPPKQPAEEHQSQQKTPTKHPTEPAQLDAKTVESADVMARKSGKEMQLEGEIEKLKGDLAKVN